MDLADEQLIDAEIDSTPPPEPTVAQGQLGRVLLGVSLILIAFNLRPVFSSLSVLLPEIMQATGLSPSSASLMTTLPVLCLGLFAPIAPILARRYGAERTILAVLVLLAFGTGLRGLASVPALLVGSVFAGASIAIVNVLLPGLVKRDFPTHAAMMTGLFTMALCAGAASAAGFTVPLEHLLNGSWPLALAAWAIPVVVVTLLWAPQALLSKGHARGVGPHVSGLWRDKLAWQVTLFMGLQSALAYCVFGWLAPILRERGLDAVTAGVVVSVSVLVQMAACLLVPSIAVRGRDQRLINVALVVCAVIGLLGCLFAPLSTVWIWAMVQGVGQGGLIAVAMTLIILRSPDAHVAAQLSGMAQGVGYVLAACGPLIVGFLRDWTGSFRSTAILFLAIGLGAALCGLGAGRARHVGEKEGV
ncbi:CynX/NimT family MFS transporter [Microvirga alba]|uniref:MFS transporter n=1 Tax=Microvirga alba TaxID=2791025 RepID=A0A931FPC9_9HYPH|nr:MFS transporter [Microvirga alba]MBF9234874.1 MFS transporter [Microvirga alba]